MTGDGEGRGERDFAIQFCPLNLNATTRLYFERDVEREHRRTAADIPRSRHA